MKVSIKHFLSFLMLFQVTVASQVIPLDKKKYPHTYAFTQHMIQQYSDVVQEFVLVRDLKACQSVADLVVALPFSWIDSIESGNLLFEQYIQDYLKYQRKIKYSWLYTVDWDKVAIGVIACSMIMLTYHAYKIEGSINTLDHRIKSNWLFQLTSYFNKK